MNPVEDTRLHGVAVQAAKLLDVEIGRVAVSTEVTNTLVAEYSANEANSARCMTEYDVGLTGDELRVIANIDDEPETLAHPELDGIPAAQFYAGVPLRALSGGRLGTLSVVGLHPRQPSDGELDQLCLLAGTTSAVLESQRELRSQDRRNAEQSAELERSLRRNRELELFAGYVAHEIRAPANRIRALATLCFEDARQESDELRRMLGRMVSSSESLAELLTNLLSLASASRAATRHETFALCDVVNCVVGELQPLASSTTVRVFTRVPSTLHMLSMRTRVRQIVHNLLSNAIKYSSPKRGSRVWIEARMNHENTTIVIRDNGVGIPAGRIDEVFEPFNRLHPGHAKGTGLGAAIVREHVTALDGVLEVSSSPEGTEVSVVLPHQRMDRLRKSA